MAGNYPQAVLGEASLAAYFRLCEAPGALTLYDARGALAAAAGGSAVTLGGPAIRPSDPAAGSASVSGTGAITCDAATEAATRFDRGNGCTVEAWIVPQMGRGSGSQTQVIWDKRTSDSANRGYILFASWDGAQGHTVLNAQINNNIGTNNSIRVRTQVLDLANGSAYHVAFTYDGSSTAAGTAFYVDAVAQPRSADQDTLSATISATVPPQIGSIVPSGLSWLGRLQDVAVYSAALGGGAISAHYAAGTAAPDDRLPWARRPPAIRPPPPARPPAVWPGWAGAFAPAAPEADPLPWLRRAVPPAPPAPAPRAARAPWSPALAPSPAPDPLAWLLRSAPAPAPGVRPPATPQAGWRPAFTGGPAPPVRHALVRFWRGPEAHMPRLEDGEPAWATDTKSLWMGSASGNVRIGP